MIAETRQRYLSADEFFALRQSPEYADRNIDLVEGVIVDMGQTGGEHGELITQLAGLLREYVRPPNWGASRQETPASC